MAIEKAESINFMMDEMWKWKMMEEKFDNMLKLYNYHEIHLPILQNRHLLQQGITAFMQKEEPEFISRQTLNINDQKNPENQLSLRPEGTISVLYRAASLYRKGDVFRYYYQGPMFHRNREGVAQESSQLGVELVGSSNILSENEIISLGIRLLNEVGFYDATLKLNSYGCENCRRQFFIDVKTELKTHSDRYCPDCLQELGANPFAATHCENEHCQHSLPPQLQISNYLCPECKARFEQIKKIQANLGNIYKVDPYLTKNFAYYNGTVFDFVVKKQDNELVVGGGGRYDYLSERLTGRKIPAIGFYLDLDLIFQLMKERNLFLMFDNDFSVYIYAQSPELEMMVLQIAQELHSQNIITVLGTEENPEDNLKQAQAHKCDLMITLREENIREGKLLLYNLEHNEQTYIPLNRLLDAVQLVRKTLKK